MNHLVQFAALMAATTTTKKSSSVVPLLVIVVVAAAGYFFFLRPQQQKARAARQQNSSVQVGDEVQTIGGIVGTVVSIENDRVTLISGKGDSGKPTEIVLVRQAIARRLVPAAQPEADLSNETGMSYGLDEKAEEGTASGHDEESADAPETPGDEGEGEGETPPDKGKGDGGK